MGVALARFCVYPDTRVTRPVTEGLHYETRRLRLGDPLMAGHESESGARQPGRLDSLAGAAGFTGTGSSGCAPRRRTQAGTGDLRDN
jgi:hypothetical protein